MADNPRDTLEFFLGGISGKMDHIIEQQKETNERLAAGDRNFEELRGILMDRPCIRYKSDTTCPTSQSPSSAPSLWTGPVKWTTIGSCVGGALWGCWEAIRALATK